MENRVIKIEDLTDLLAQKSGMDLTELSIALGITRATLNNWKRGSVNKINYKVREKLARALDKHNWGFHINKFVGNNIEIIYQNHQTESADDISSLYVKIDSLQNLLSKVLSENFVLKEKIEKYEGKKK